MGARNATRNALSSCERMNTALQSLHRGGALLVINLLFFMVWGFAGIGKLLDGTPPWFGAKFGQTILALSRSRGFVLAVGRGRSACLRARGCGPGARRILRPPGSH